MPRYLLTIEYDGTPYLGWQRQDDGPSVQAVIEQAITGFCGERVKVYCAGRTDRGVHALAQTAHIDLGKDWPTDTVRHAINAHMLDEPVTVLSARIVDPGFNARFDAFRRHYRYRILVRRGPPAIDHNRVWHHPGKLDSTLMHEAAQLLLGKHDFTSFRASQCQAKSPIKTMLSAKVEQMGDEIVLQFEAPSFLHNQVRAMTGTLARIGERKWPVCRIPQILAAKDRTVAGPNAPPCGLYLVHVGYPKDKLTL